MADDKTVEILDEHGKEIRSQANKYLAPPVAPEDLTRVQVGPGPADYEYVDPASLFAMERLIAVWRVDGKVVKSHGQGFKKFVRDIAERAFEFWPAGGYVVRGPFDSVLIEDAPGEAVVASATAAGEATVVDVPFPDEPAPAEVPSTWAPCGACGAYLMPVEFSDGSSGWLHAETRLAECTVVVEDEEDDYLNEGE